MVNILPDFAGTGIIGSHRLASDSVTTAKIADNSVELAKMYGDEKTFEFVNGVLAKIINK